MSRDSRISLESSQHHRAISPGAHELHGVPERALETAQNDKRDGASQ